ncbi:hypothetical protein QN277_013371 [Acacia crassicarpa]|nr:hypothetical protein QN277_013371 [Acacia crassicarpa]
MRFHSTHALELPIDQEAKRHLPEQSLNQSQIKTLVLNNYTHGKFFNLVTNVVALPTFLLTACHNLATPHAHDAPSSPSLIESVSRRISIEEMARELRENRFDVGACCVSIPPTRKNGKPLVLPNLKLKVLIEAIRMVLEVVYDERFVTFAYGGRVGMGRHTAIRYLKNSVHNPTWWFTVSFNRQKFDKSHVDKLCLFIQHKVEDSFLVDLIKMLFACQALEIELGGAYLGRGFPQECELCPILVNIYFDGFDKEIQHIRLAESQENPKLDPKLTVSTSDVFYKPVKIYAVRYLDEILIITSGSKMFTMDLMNQVMKHLELNLELQVDKLNTAIHSAVSEKINFLGMELRAVPPSVLHPPMSEKAIRARKKYLRQKEVRALELKNARERNRKKLGLKIFCHVYKKLKRSNGFKIEFNIENEVREIFKSWADEVAQEFLGNIDERREWHQRLSAGDFLSLHHIRNQLPPELVDSYDRFQAQVDKHLNPIKAITAMEEEEMKAQEEEEQKYAKRTIEDLTRLCMKVDAPIVDMRKAVKMVGFTNHMGRPRPIEFLVALEDADIIEWYAGIARRWLDFFCCCHNFKTVKTIVSYHLRFSCILTLAEKHESTKREAIKHYSKDLKVYKMNGDEEVHFPTEKEVKMMGDRDLSNPKPVDGTLSLALIRLASDEPPSYCIAHFCDRTTNVLYRVRLLQNSLNVNPLDRETWVPGMGAIHESLNRRCLPLCADHINDLYLGKITLQDVDCSSSVYVD